MANLIVEAVRPDQTGVATGMKTVMRTIGGAVGGQVAASILAASLLGDGLPNEQGYTLSFVVMALALAAGIIASLETCWSSGERKRVRQEAELLRASIRECHLTEHRNGGVEMA
jgi:sugar phosphate permease